ncbi:unnamed protein product, partial [Ectocarpus sp. 12 AP-2014]
LRHSSRASGEESKPRAPWEHLTNRALLLLLTRGKRWISSTSRCPCWTMRRWKTSIDTSCSTICPRRTTATRISSRPWWTTTRRARRQGCAGATSRL